MSLVIHRETLPPSAFARHGPGMASQGAGDPPRDLEGAMSARMQAKDIADTDFLTAIDTVKNLRDQTRYPIRTLGASIWDITAVLAGHPDDVLLVDGARERWDYDDMPRKVVQAKAKSLIRRGLADGCTCGCRGDFNRIGTA